jgi:nucleotide sugar dehydrogenase
MRSDQPLIGFVGQGYVGKNYADDFESRGYSVVRYSLEEPYRANEDKIKDCDIVFVAVPTPSTPKGFDLGIVKSALAHVGKGKIAVIKSTIVPGSTRQLQKAFPNIIVLSCPEFLSVATAAFDVANPFMNVVGMSEKDEKHQKAAELVMSIFKKAPESVICSSEEAELVKYGHNISGYMQILTFNLVYDLAEKFGADWNPIQRAIEADPLVCNRYANPIHKGGRGAGGYCFIKDMAAFAQHYDTHVKNKEGSALLKAAQQKNIELLMQTKKDMDLLLGVYGKKIPKLAKKVPSSRKK